MALAILKPKDVLSINVLDDPGYKRAWEKLQDLRARGTPLERRCEAWRATADSRLTERAQALLEDGAIPPAAMRLDAELETLVDELAVVRQAIKVQERVVAEEESRASRAICARLTPRHRALVQRIAAALRALDAVLDEERALREALRDGGVSFAADLRPMPLPALGLLSDPYSAISFWIRDAREHGLLDGE